MTIASDLAAVVLLASLTEHRDRGEQKALERVADRVDREINEQTGTNPHLPRHANLAVAPPCTFSFDHDQRTCVCRGDRRAIEPSGGWSRLGVLVRGEQG